MNFVSNIFKKYSHKDREKNEAERSASPQDDIETCTEVQPTQRSSKPRASVLESFDPLYNQENQDSDYEEAFEDLHQKKPVVTQSNLCDSISEEQAPFERFPDEVLKRPRIDAIKKVHAVEKLVDISSGSNLDDSIDNYKSIENSKINLSSEEENSFAENTEKPALCPVEVIEILDDTVELDSSRTDLPVVDLLKSRESSGFVSTELTVNCSDISINEYSANNSGNNSNNTFEVENCLKEDCKGNAACTESELNRTVKLECNESFVNDSVSFVDSGCVNPINELSQIKEVCGETLVVDCQQAKSDDSVIVLDKSNQIANAIDESFVLSKAPSSENTSNDINVCNTSPVRESIVTKHNDSELEKSQNGIQTISLNSTYVADNSLNELNNTIDTGDHNKKGTFCPSPILREISRETAEFEAIELALDASEKSNHSVNSELPYLTAKDSPVCTRANVINLSCAEEVGETASTEINKSLNTSQTENFHDKVNSTLEINNEINKSKEISEKQVSDKVKEGTPLLTKESDHLDELQSNNINKTQDLNETDLKSVQKEVEKCSRSSVQLNIPHKNLKVGASKETRKSIETANPSVTIQKATDIESSLNLSKNRKSLGALELKSNATVLPLTNFVSGHADNENSLDCVKAVDDKVIETLPNIANKTIKNCENQSIKNIENQQYCRPDNNTECIGSSGVPDFFNIGSLCIKNATFCQEEKGNTTSSSPLHENLNTSRKSIEPKLNENIHSVIVSQNISVENTVVNSKLDDELMSKTAIQGKEEINTSNNLESINALNQVRKSSEFLIDNRECSVLDGNRNEVGPFIPHSDSDSRPTSKSFLKHRSPSKSPKPSANNNRSTYVIDSSFEDNNNSIEDISEKEVSKTKEIKYNMADIADKVSSQQQEISDLKLQLNASQQTIASLELQIRQKEEVIIKTQAEALKKEQGYGHEVKVLKEQLAEKSLLIDKDSTSEVTQQLEKLKAREAKLLSELNARNNDHLNYKKIMDEYEQTISQKLADYQKLRDEHETATKHLANLEFSFSDVHSKYERSKAIIDGYKANEATLRHNLEVAEQATRHHEEKYESLKAHAKAQIDKSNKEILQMRDRYEAEISKLHAFIKRLEIKVGALEVSLDQKIQECTALSALCDEVTGKRV